MDDTEAADLASLGWDAQWADELERRWPRRDAHVTPGRVVRVDRGRCLVVTERGRVAATWGGGLLEQVAADELFEPCTGDWCVVRSWPGGPVTVETVLDRRTSLVRAESGRSSRGQVLVANLDLAGVVVGLLPDPSIARVERLLTLAWESGATPVVILTKSDLVPDAGLVAEDVAAAAPGVEVVVCSTVTGEGYETLRRLVGGARTLGLLGPSGAGKSTLANTLTGSAALTTRELRADGRGRHTSVRRELVRLPDGGAVVDTPGLRGVGLIESAAGLAAAFADVEQLADRCRFRDCTHTVEPGCAVLEAVNAGDLPVRRFESWRKLRRETEWMASRTDARLRAQRLREWRRRTKEHRRNAPHE